MFFLPSTVKINKTKVYEGVLPNVSPKNMFTS
jgi:hypothetical protein